MTGSLAATWPTLEVIRTAGLARLTPTILDFLERGSGDETTLNRNREQFSRWGFSPRPMSGLAAPSLSTTLFGHQLALPVLTAPFGADRLFHPDGQRAVVRSAAGAGVLSIVPEASSFPLEQLRSDAPASAKVGQFHPMGAPENVLRIIRRYEAAGYEALCVTLDCPTPGWREHNLRNGYVISSDVVGGNYPPGDEVAMEQALGQLFPHDEPVWSWEQLSRMMANTSLPWIAKGILDPIDAGAAVTAGASAVLVSNHGGRQLDGVPSSIEALAPIASELGGQVPVLLDSGIRTGADIIKAVALGADAVVIGRLAAYGLAAAGQSGVDRVFELLAAEMKIILTLLGHGSIGDIGPQALLRL